MCGGGFVGVVDDVFYVGSTACLGWQKKKKGPVTASLPYCKAHRGPFSLADVPMRVLQPSTPAHVCNYNHVQFFNFTMSSHIFLDYH